METRTFYFPANRFGRDVLNYIWRHVSCSIGEIRKVADSIAVPITTVPKEIVKVERILKTYDLM